MTRPDFHCGSLWVMWCLAMPGLAECEAGEHADGVQRDQPADLAAGGEEGDDRCRR